MDREDWAEMVGDHPTRILIEVEETREIKEEEEGRDIKAGHRSHKML